LLHGTFEPLIRDCGAKDLQAYLAEGHFRLDADELARAADCVYAQIDPANGERRAPA
jgi:hypothetical protein